MSPDTLSLRIHLRPLVNRLAAYCNARRAFARLLAIPASGSTSRRPGDPGPVPPDRPLTWPGPLPDGNAGSQPNVDRLAAASQRTRFAKTTLLGVQTAEDELPSRAADPSRAVIAPAPPGNGPLPPTDSPERATTPVGP